MRIKVVFVVSLVDVVVELEKKFDSQYFVTLLFLFSLKVKYKYVKVQAKDI